MAGGMAGGSVDAAGTLLACDRLWGLNLPVGELAELGAELGSDVSFLLYGAMPWVWGAASNSRRWRRADAWNGCSRRPARLGDPLVYRRFDEMADRGAIVPDAGLPMR